MRVGYSSMGRRGRRPRLDSGTCNVCSAPCSSCMHRNGGITGLKSDESSDENSHGVVVGSQCSFSEASNLVNPNRDTSPEIAESKGVIRYSGKDKGSSLKSSSGMFADHQATNIPGQGKVKEKQGTENNKDKENTLAENLRRSDHSERVGMSGESEPLELDDECNASAMSVSESEPLELDDVNLCDICGDAGREDLLAICSRCSDGAEHIYCMRVMLKKVPEGEWLCEDCKLTEQAEKKKRETRGKREAEVNSNAETSSKRHMDKPEAAPEAQRQAVEASTGSPKKPVLPRLLAFSRETSFKGLEKTTRKLAHHSSFTSRSSDDTENTRSTDSQLPSPKGSLFKSNSFNSSSSRPKVRPVDDFMHPRQKTSKENASLDVKEGFSRNAGKSMSTRCTDVAYSSCNDSKVKGSKQLKDWSSEGNQSASTFDQKLISRGNSSISYTNGARDGKGLQSDGKQGGLVKQARHPSRNRLEDIVVSDEKCSSSEQIPSEAKRKDELTNVDGFPRSRAFRETGEKNKDAIGNRQRSDLLPGSNSTTRNIREDVNKGNRLRAAVDAALRKKPSFGKNRGLEQSDLPSVPNMDSSCDKALQNMPSKVPVIRDWPVGLQRLQGGNPNLQTEKQTSAVNGRQSTLTGVGADTMASSQTVEPEADFPSSKPAVIELPVVTPSTTSAIPEHEYIWQGDLEVRKGKNLALMCSGVQAYLSTLASPKVVEVANKFPVKVSLNEVSRLSAWPAQFQDIGAKEDHVALFFFAKDIESYEKNYKPLVDNMIQKDLALKGNLEGAELLIFASNQLPQNCQRWNTFYFLWGVFRGGKKNVSNPLKNSPVTESCVLPNVGKSFSTREGFCHENPSNRESLNDHASIRMEMDKENAKVDEVRSSIDKEKAFSVSYGHSGVVEETEEGEIGFSPCLKNDKIGPRTVNSSGMNQKVDLDGLSNEDLCEGPVNKKLKTGSGGETEWSMYRSGYESASRKSCLHPSEGDKKIKKKRGGTERIVFPLDLNDGKEDDGVEMVDNNRQGSLGMVPNLELALGEEKATTSMGVVLPFTTGTTSNEEQRSSYSHKRQDEVRNPEASLSLSLSFSSLDKEQQQQQNQKRAASGWEHKKQNANSPMFLFRDFPDKSS